MLYIHIVLCSRCRNFNLVIAIKATHYIISIYKTTAGTTVPTSVATASSAQQDIDTIDALKVNRIIQG